MSNDESLTAKQLLEQSGLTPKKIFGQNFLFDKNILKKIIDVAQLKKTDNVLEVGPGLGTLTRELLAKAKQVVAIEKDHEMCQVIMTNYQLSITKQQKKSSITNNIKLKLVCADILRVTDEELREYFKGKPYRVVANLPYNITSHFLKIFLEREYAPSDMTIMIQREVGQRIMASPGQLSLLSISVQFFSDPKIEFVVHPGSFFPSPKVDSVVIHLKNIRKNKFAVDPDKFFKILKIGFSQKRKQLKAVLGKGKILDKSFTVGRIGEILVGLGYTDTARAQELSIQDWVNLVNQLVL